MAIKTRAGVTLVSVSDGNTGSAGVSVTSVAPYFQQTSRGAATPAKPTTSTPPSPWVPAEPDFAFSKDLFRTDRVGFSNGTFAYTAVSKVSGNFGASYVFGMVQSATHVGSSAPTSEGSPFIGQMWWVTSSTNNFVDLKRYDGTSWQQFKIMASSIMAAKSVSAELLEAGAVRAEHLDVQYTDASTGQRISIQPDGIRLWGVEDDGEPTISLTTSDAQSFSILDTNDRKAAGIDNKGNVVGSAVIANNSLLYKGQEMQAILDNMPHGIVAAVERSTYQIIPSQRGLIDVHWFPQPGRMYRIMANLMFYQPESGIGQMKYQLKHTTDLSAPTIDSNTTDREMYAPSNRKGYGDQNYKTWVYMNFVRYSEVAAFPNFNLSKGLRSALIGTPYEWATTLHADHHTWLTIEDVGPEIEFQTSNYTWAPPEDNVTPPAAPKTTYEKTLAPIDYASYMGNSGYYNYNTSQVYQGLSPAGYGALRGLWIFPSLVGDLSGATVNSVQVYLKNNHSYYGAGVTANIQGHGYGSRPGTYGGGSVNLANVAFAKGEGKWIDITSFGGLLKSGAGRGVGIIGSTTGEYAYFGGPDARLFVRYTK